jgi:FkbM family methyltransferase
MRNVAQRIVPLVDRLPSRIARAMRSGSGLARITRPVVNRVLPDVETVVTVRSGHAEGLRLPILPRDEKYYWTGTYEQEVQDALAHLLKPGMHFWDVGAHIGFFTLIAARIVGASGHVASFEPMPITRARLIRGLALNDFTNVEVSEFALTNADGAQILRPPRDVGPARHRVAARRDRSPMWSLIADNETARGVEVETRRLDTVLRSADAPPDVVKIDVEGVVIEVLSGGMELFQEERPAVIFEMAMSEERLRILERLLVGYHFNYLGEVHWLAT